MNQPLGPDEIDLLALPEESNTAIDLAAQAAQHAYNNAQAQAQASAGTPPFSGGMMGGYPTKAMQNAAPVAAAPSLEEEQAQAKRIDEMTIADYQRGIRKMKVYIAP